MDEANTDGLYFGFTVIFFSVFSIIQDLLTPENLEMAICLP